MKLETVITNTQDFEDVLEELHPGSTVIVKYTDFGDGGTGKDTTISLSVRGKGPNNEKFSKQEVYLSAFKLVIFCFLTTLL